MKDHYFINTIRQTVLNISGMICFLIMLLFAVIFCSCAYNTNQTMTPETFEISSLSSNVSSTTAPSSSSPSTAFKQITGSFTEEIKQNTVKPQIHEETVYAVEPIGKVICIADYYVNIRKGPGTDTPIIGIFPKGSWADVLLFEPGWVMISYDDMIGYVSRNYVVSQSIPDNPVPAGDWTLILINPDNHLPKQFEVDLAEFENGYVDARIFDICIEMFSDAAEDGISLVLVDAYRSYERQMELYQEKVNRYMRDGYERQEALRIAATITAYPDTSEHQTGLALDIVTSSYRIRDKGFENTKAYKWLAANAHNYGFILRYPESKTAITKIIYEPWHWRFVGAGAARDIKDRGISFEEYLND